MIREHISDEWQVVDWDTAISYVAARMRDIQQRYGTGAIGGITSSRCTNEEVYVVQKMVRAAFGNNNVDTCARVCHSPTGYGLKQTLGESAGTQDFRSVAKSDVILVIGANPTDAHPVFASRMKRRLRDGAKLVVIDPRSIDLVRSPHIEAQHHLRLNREPTSRSSTRWPTSWSPRGWSTRSSSMPAAKASSSGRNSSPNRSTAQRPPRPSPVFPLTTSEPRHGCTRRAATPPSTTDWASPSTARARPW